MKKHPSSAGQKAQRTEQSTTVQPKVVEQVQARTVEPQRVVQQGSAQKVQELQTSQTTAGQPIRVLYSDNIPMTVEPDSVRNSVDEVVKTSTEKLQELFGVETAAKHYSIKVTYFAPFEHIRQNPQKYTDPENWRGGYSTQIVDNSGKEVTSSELVIRYYLVQQLGAEEAFKVNITFDEGVPKLTDKDGKPLENIDLKDLIK